MKRTPIEPADLSVVDHTDDVLRDRDGELVASSLTTMLCECCGQMWIGAIDRKRREFCKLPLTPQIARAVAAELVALAEESETIAATGKPHRH